MQLDFFEISTRSPKKNIVEVYPTFNVGKCKDLMIRGSDFYAIWNPETNLWSTDEDTVIDIIDAEVRKAVEEEKLRSVDCLVRGLYLRKSESKMIDSFHNYVKKQMRNNAHPLDECITFKNVETTREDYVSRKLGYSIEDIPCPAYDELMSVLYSDDERHKLEWAIGAIITGESKYIQKFIVMYGSAGTGKSTVLNIIQDLFDGYWSVFDAKALGSANASFALEPFANNPLVAIQHDGDLSHIEDNTRLNSLVSHEQMTVNEKFKSAYQMRFNCFLFMGTNKPVKITDAKSGILRRLIDVTPTGDKIPPKKYKELVSRIKFELGGIAYRCVQVYKEDPGAYDDYIPVNMMGASNDFYNYVLEYYDTFKKQDSTTLKQAWEMYLTYCEDSKVLYPYGKRLFREELKSYFNNFYEQMHTEDGHVRSYYEGFRFDKFEYESVRKVEKLETSMSFESVNSVFDICCADCKAQYAGPSEAPLNEWAEVTTTLKDLDTSKLHYVLGPENLIFVDFDIKDENGNKSFKLNAEAASKWPPTYGELSKGGQGIHLYYYYKGDVSELSCFYSEGIEIKVRSGNSSIRRRLSYCNDLDIQTISSGLPLKEAKKVVNFDGVTNEKGIRTRIIKNLRKEYHPATKPSVDFIFKILEDAYNSGIPYDVTDLRPDILAFAAKSTNNSAYCIRLVNKMHFHSEEASEDKEFIDEELVFFDVEVFSNLFVVVYKKESGPCVKMIDPKPEDIERLLKYRLVGFNCRRYDNHILYARLIGYDNQQLFMLSQRIINGSANAFFREAYNISYTDIYDFSAKKQSLKKFEIELGIHHQECGLKWDEPVPDDMVELVADYCCNDVIATQAVFEARKGDFTARKILATLAKGSVNDTTNSLTTRIIFGNERHPELVYTDLSETFPGYEFISPAESEDKKAHNVYMGEDVGFGGYVYAEPGMYTNVALLDVASLHPHSITAMNCFGKYTERFKEIMDARILIKHKDFDGARKILNGQLSPFLDDESVAKDLSQALKIAINSVYGLTSASFDNPFRDPRNVNNIVALRGALFMVTLKHEVQARGYTVAHIKTDSIKIPNADNDIIQFCMDFANKYGYDFEHEATYEKLCLVNDAVYIAKDAADGHWTATGTQFQVPFVFKTLFSKQPTEFSDFCETKEVKTALYLDYNENLAEGEHDYQFIGKVGLFCPILPGKGGAELFRYSDPDKYSYATGAKGYRWLEAESVERLGMQDAIDMSYYAKMVDDAKDAIAKFGDPEWFCSD